MQVCSFNALRTIIIACTRDTGRPRFRRNSIDLYVCGYVGVVCFGCSLLLWVFFFFILFFVAVATLMKGTPNYSRFCDILVQFFERNWLDVALMPIAVSNCVRQTSGECKRFFFSIHLLHVCPLSCCLSNTLFSSLPRQQVICRATFLACNPVFVRKH